jgi:aldehyde:ferredoxin oxidoreductase
MRLLMRYLPSFAIATTDLSDYSAILSGIMGYNVSQKDFTVIGERIFNLERLMNCREGISRVDDTLPHRILNEVREDGFPGIELTKMLDEYYKLRGWEKNGYPGAKVLAELDIHPQNNQLLEVKS